MAAVLVWLLASMAAVLVWLLASMAAVLVWLLASMAAVLVWLLVSMAAMLVCLQLLAIVASVLALPLADHHRHPQTTSSPSPPPTDH